MGQRREFTTDFFAFSRLRIVTGSAFLHSGLNHLSVPGSGLECVSCIEHQS
jgi:hypothetical protein